MTMVFDEYEFCKTHIVRNGKVGYTRIGSIVWLITWERVWLSRYRAYNVCFTNTLLNVIYTVPDFSDRRLRTAIVLLRLLCGYSDANMTEGTVQRVAVEYFRVRSTLKYILRLAKATAMLRYMIPAYPVREMWMCTFKHNRI